MISIIKEICIFMIIAQAILFFVPGGSYGKYVRLLVGMMLILRLIEPLFGLLVKEERQLEIKEKIGELEQAIHMESREPVFEDSQALVSREIGEELKNKLEQCDDAHRILGVDFGQEKENIVITISQKSGPGREGEIWIEPVQVGNEETEDEGEKEELKALYGSCLGVEAERIEIVWKK